MAFFEYCKKCGAMFSVESEWHEHLKQHDAAKKKESDKLRKPFAEAEEKVLMETAKVVPGADPAEVEDMRVARTKDLRTIKKELKKAGIECQTMNADEAKAAYEKLKKEGKVNDAARV